jgi:hypothetical protein
MGGFDRANLAGREISGEEVGTIVLLSTSRIDQGNWLNL